ncbi:diacylglycerol/lipid kinase family protein [Paenisporosarcina cavernae]|uniref:Diacylglycerol kinase family lipid kinase n=1 Tax=Paenisporosarcina cavernae TaxID=2320858 RepID=A0A385YU35_9BACL|nr:diacylglycerol kinase family protein [Paenisporosarcina cavernae]AYC30385.1 diacylglycerol kinase family lipid kinase [Paenisporosarcina cavernae]
MKKAMFILNPSSGKELASTFKKRTLDKLTSLGYEVVLKETEGEGDATKFAKQACDGTYDLVTAMGGDGTINEAVNGLAEEENRPVFSFVPLGTVNDFARALGIPLEPGDSIEMLEKSRAKKVDIAKVENNYFMNILAVGAVAESVSSVSVEQKTKLGALAYMVEGVKALTANDEKELTIIHDGGTWKGKAVITLVALTNSVGGFEKLAPHAETDDGYLHVFIIKQTGLAAFARMGAAILRGKLEEDQDVIAFKSKVVRIETETPMICNLDGDDKGETPIEISILPKHLEVLVPLADD